MVRTSIETSVENNSTLTRKWLWLTITEYWISSPHRSGAQMCPEARNDAAGI